MERYSLLLISLLSVSVPSFLRADILSVGSASLGAGVALGIPVMISGATDVYAFQFDMTFNPSILQLQSIEEGPFLASAGSTFFIPGTIDNIAGTATFTADTLLGPGPDASGTGTLATFDFLAEAIGNSSLDLANVILLDSSLNDIAFTTRSGSVMVTGPVSATPEPDSFGLLALVFVVLFVFKVKSARRWCG